MKSNRKTIIASLATIGMSCALLGGATFALFTDDDSANIAITSGKVQVTAKVTDYTTYTDLYGVRTDGDWLEGGSVAVEDGNVTLSNIVPGDGVDLTLEVTNESTVAIKYQVRVGVEGSSALFNDLEVTIGDYELIGNGSTKSSAWTELGAGAEIGDLKVSIYYPEECIEQHLDEAECKVVLTVAAVQGNAKTYDPVVANPDWDGENIEDLADLMAFRDAVNGGENFSGKTVTLKADLDLGGIDNWEPIGTSTNKFVGTFDGNNHTISNLSVKEAENIGYNTHGYLGLFGSIQSATLKDFAVENVNINAPHSNYVGAVAGTGLTPKISGVTVTGDITLIGCRWTGGIIGNSYGTYTNCKVLQTGGEGIGSTYQKAGGIAGQMSQGTISGCTVEATVKAASAEGVTNYGTVGGLIGGMSNEGASTIEDNVVNVTIDASEVTTDSVYTNATWAQLTGALIGNPGGTATGTTKINNNSGSATISSASGIYRIGIVGAGGYTEIGDNNITVIWNGDLYVNGAKAETISGAQELVAFAEKINGGEGLTGTYVLTEDITLESEWTPVGTAANAFNGTFDGNGHTISNVSFSSDVSVNAGFFGVLGGNADVRNFTLNNVNITVDGDNASIGVGAVAGKGVISWTNDYKSLIPTIEKVTVTGTLLLKGSSEHTHVGGIVGYTCANVINCTIDVEANEEGNIVGNTYVGGLVGHMEDARPLASGSDVIISENTLKNVVIKGIKDVGGIAGIAQGNVTVSENTLTNVKIIADEKVGAIFGEAYLYVANTWGAQYYIYITFENNSGDVTINTAAPAPSDDEKFIGLKNGVPSGNCNIEVTSNNNSVTVNWNA